MARYIAYLLNLGSNSVRWNEFKVYAGTRRDDEQKTRHLTPKGFSRFRELWTIIHNALDLHGDVHLYAKELTTALHSAGEWGHLAPKLADTRNCTT